jgi:hypothetical protein
VHGNSLEVKAMPVRFGRLLADCHLIRNASQFICDALVLQLPTINLLIQLHSRATSVLILVERPVKNRIELALRERRQRSLSRTLLFCGSRCWFLGLLFFLHVVNFSILFLHRLYGCRRNSSLNRTRNSSRASSNREKPSSHIRVANPMRSVPTIADQ